MTIFYIDSPFPRGQIRWQGCSSNSSSSVGDSPSSSLDVQRVFTCSVTLLRTLLPGQGALEGVPQVEQAPADDHVVIKSHEEAHLRGNDGL